MPCRLTWLRPAAAAALLLLHCCSCMLEARQAAAEPRALASWLAGSKHVSCKLPIQSLHVVLRGCCTAGPHQSRCSRARTCERAARRRRLPPSASCPATPSCAIRGQKLEAVLWASADGHGNILPCDGCSCMSRVNAIGCMRDSGSGRRTASWKTHVRKQNRAICWLVCDHQASSSSQAHPGSQWQTVHSQRVTL